MTDADVLAAISRLLTNAFSRKAPDMPDSHRQLWKVSFQTPPDPLLPEVTAELLSSDDRLAYSRGALLTTCIVLARDLADALAFGRKLQSAWYLLDGVDGAAGAYGRGWNAALAALRTFIQYEQHHTDSQPTSLEWIGAKAQLERLNTWAQAHTSGESDLDTNCPVTERPL